MTTFSSPLRRKHSSNREKEETVKTCVVVSLIACLILGVAVVGAAQDTQPWIPGIASLAIPGLGQLLNDELDKALVHFGIDIGIIVLGSYVTGLLPYTYVFSRYALVSAAHLAWSLFSAYDAYSVAKDQGFSISVVENSLRFSYRY